MTDTQEGKMVKRYTIQGAWIDEPFVEISSAEMVMHADYAALQARCEALEKSVKEARKDLALGVDLYLAVRQVWGAVIFGPCVFLDPVGAALKAFDASYAAPSPPDRIAVQTKEQP